MSRDFGDFQTPKPLVKLVLDAISQEGKAWNRILEPTCGVGNFIDGVMDHIEFRSGVEIKGIEIQQKHVNSAWHMVERKNRREHHVLFGFRPSRTPEQG